MPTVVTLQESQHLQGIDRERVGQGLALVAVGAQYASRTGREGVGGGL